MKQYIITTTALLLLFISYGEWCKYYGHQQIISIPIICTADRVVLSGKHHDNAAIRGLTCNGHSVTLEGLRVGRIVYKDNVRVLGMVKQREEK